MKLPLRLHLVFLLTPLAVWLLAEGCVSPPDYPKEPHIEYIDLSKKVLRRSSNPFADTTFVTFSFTDGDGNLGTDSALVLVDLRNGGSTRLSIPELPELGAANGLKGEITARIFTTCCVFPPDEFLNGCVDELDSMPFDTVRYELYMVDQAGNESNRIQLDPILIQCFE